MLKPGVDANDEILQRVILIFKKLDRIITESVNSLEPENSTDCFMVNELYKIQYDFGRSQLLEKLWEDSNTNLMNQLEHIKNTCDSQPIIDIFTLLLQVTLYETIEFEARVLVTDCDENSKKDTKFQSYTDIILEMKHFIILLFFMLFGSSTPAETGRINGILGKHLTQSRGIIFHRMRRKIGLTYKTSINELDMFQMKVYILFDFSSARGFPVCHRNRNKNYIKSQLAKGYRILSLIIRYPNGDRTVHIGVLEADHDKGHKQVIALVDKAIDDISKTGNFKKIGLRCDNCAGENKNKHLLLYTVKKRQTGNFDEIETMFCCEHHGNFEPDQKHGTMYRRTDHWATNGRVCGRQGINVESYHDIIMIGKKFITPAVAAANNPLERSITFYSCFNAF